MKFLKPVLVASALVLTLHPAAHAQSGVAGDWEITLNTPQGSNTVNLSLTQDGDKVTGDLNSPMGSVPVTGTSTGGALAITAHIDIQGTALDLGLNGKLEGEALNGTVKFGDFGEFPFTGKRAAKAAAAAPAAAAAAPATALAATDANGKWDIVLKIEGVGDFPVSAELKQDGDKVTGKFSSAAGDVDVAGTMAGKALKLEFTAETPQGPLPVTMTGDLGAGGFTGKANIAGLGDADWTGTKVQ
jgi:hypothetical protein